MDGAECSLAGRMRHAARCDSIADHCSFWRVPLHIIRDAATPVQRSSMSDRNERNMTKRKSLIGFMSMPRPGVVIRLDREEFGRWPGGWKYVSRTFQKLRMGEIYITVFVEPSRACDKDDKGKVVILATPEGEYLYVPLNNIVGLCETL